MSSGTLPFRQYHRTCHLGDGTFGSVVTVYNNDGDEYAMKLFREDENDDDDDDDEYTPAQPMSIGTLRELSCLRLLRGENAHANIIEMVDVQPKADDDDDDGGRGAGTSNYMGLTLPLGRQGSLADAMAHPTFSNATKWQKVHVASGLVAAIHYLHETCGMAHRDIKSDNVLLEYHSADPERWVPILIDFSLAKPISTVMWRGNNRRCHSHTTMLDMESVPHTGEVGTLIYTAPEVMLSTEQGFYDPKAIDMYSIGVVLLELMQNHPFTAQKYKEARVQIQSALDALPTNVPFPHLIRQLCETDPALRITAVEAVQHDVFTKFGMDLTTTCRSDHHIDIQTALPYDFPSSPAANDEDQDNNQENQPPASTGRHETMKQYERRRTMIDRILTAWDSDHPLTRHAAFDYSRCYEQIDESIDDDGGGSVTTTTTTNRQAKKKNPVPSQSLLDCCLLAYRFFELQVLDLPSAVTDYYPHWDYDDYIDNEMTILMMMDYCLYPRSLAF